MGNNDLLPFDKAAQPQEPGVLEFDASPYMDDLDDLELTDEQKIEFLRALWSIMAAFVEYGFGGDSVIPLLAQKASENGADALQKDIPTHEFNVAADDEPERFEP